MNDPKILVLISKHIAGEETTEEKLEIKEWLAASSENLVLFNKIKNTWLAIKEVPTPFFKKFNRKYMTNVVISKTIGNLVGFAVGLLIANSFTHYVTERRSVKNLFGFAGRKKVVVNDIPEWTQYGLSIILGFIVLELINYFFESKKHLLIIDKVKLLLNNIDKK